MNIHKDIYFNLSMAAESNILSTTGCKLPCSFMEFQLAGMLQVQNILGFQLQFGKDYMIEAKEAYVYDSISFVSELGGSLGLLLGFSMIMIWDFAKLVFFKCSRSNK